MCGNTQTIEQEMMSLLASLAGGSSGRQAEHEQCDGTREIEFAVTLLGREGNLIAEGMLDTTSAGWLADMQKWVNQRLEIGCASMVDFHVVGHTALVEVINPDESRVCSIVMQEIY